MATRRAADAFPRCECYPVSIDPTLACCFDARGRVRYRRVEHASPGPRFQGRSPQPGCDLRSLRQIGRSGPAPFPAPRDDWRQQHPPPENTMEREMAHSPSAGRRSGKVGQAVPVPGSPRREEKDSRFTAKGMVSSASPSRNNSSTVESSARSKFTRCEGCVRHIKCLASIA